MNGKDSIITATTGWSAFWFLQRRERDSLGVYDFFLVSQVEQGSSSRQDSSSARLDDTAKDVLQIWVDKIHLQKGCACNTNQRSRSVPEKYFFDRKDITESWKTVEAHWQTLTEPKQVASTEVIAMMLIVLTVVFTIDDQG